MASSDVEHWQCDKTLPQCMAYMLDNQIMCDVTFLLGEERHEVKAHKYMLASRSPVFHAMLDGPMSERGNIEISDIDLETFQLFLRYVYTDAVSLTTENATRLLYVAKKYCLDLLTHKCKTFVQGNMNSNNACAIIETTIKCPDEEIYQSCLQQIKENTEVCIKSQDFIAISKEILKSITELDEITVKEELLFEQVMKWCDAECGRQGLPVTWMNKRKVLDDTLYNLRFPVMEMRYFAEHVGCTELLTSDEKVEVFMYHTLGRQEYATCKNFNIKSRKKLYVDTEEVCFEPRKYQLFFEDACELTADYPEHFYYEEKESELTADYPEHFYYEDETESDSETKFTAPDMQVSDNESSSVVLKGQK